MKISIITVCYNSEKTIEKTVQSVLKQTYSDIEYIIIDGNSKDNTLGILEKYSSNISKIISEPDFGIYDAINKGIKISSGEIIGLLHADDEFAYNDAIKDVRSCFYKNEIDAIYSDLQYLKKNKIHRHWKSGKFVISKFKWGWMPPHPTFYCKKKCFEKLGYYNLKFSISADYELMLRFLYKNKIKVEYLPRVLVLMQIGGKSNASIQNRLLANNEDKIAWIVNNLTPYFFTFWLKPVRKLFQFILHFLIKKQKNILS